MKHKKLWLALGIGSAVGAAGVFASLATTHYLMKMALDREAPKRMTKKRIRGTDYGEDAENMLAQAARALEEKKTEQVEIQSADGIRLVGHWYPAENARRVIIAMHGWRSCWSRDFGTIADFWHDNGCHILFTEQRGQNNSEGAYMGFGILERHDCREWAWWVNMRSGGTLPIYLAGVSMGATTVLMASSLHLPQTVTGIIADCGFTSPKDIVGTVYRRVIHLPPILSLWAVNVFSNLLAGFGLGDRDTRIALANSKVPVLMIHGREDGFVPCKMSQDGYDACTGKKKLFLVDGADHGVSFIKNRDGYVKEVVSFLEETVDSN